MSKHRLHSRRSVRQATVVHLLAWVAVIATLEVVMRPEEAETVPTETSAAPSIPPDVVDSLRFAPVPTSSPGVPAEGSGTFVAVAGSGLRTGAGKNLLTYRVEMEGGVPVDATGFAATVEQILADPSGWASTGDYSFQRDDMAPVRIVWATR